MTFEQLLQFYTLCMQVGFCRIIHDTNSIDQNVVALYGPMKDESNYRFQMFSFNDESNEFLRLMKPTCWISNFRSKKVVKKLLAFDSYFKTKYPNSVVKHFLKFRSNKVVIKTTVDSSFIKKVLKLKLFTVNNNAKTE